MFSQALTTEHLRDFATMAGIELAVIDKHTEIEAYRDKLRWNEIYYHLGQGLGRV